MDNKVRLNEAQLRQVIAFIERRGFHDPGVIVEILDHFACKVEERMCSSALSLEEAMVQAHADFGTLGFYPIMACYEANTRKKYKAVYRRERNRILTTPWYIVPLLVLSVGFYYGYLWAAVHATWGGVNLFSAISYVASLVAFIIINARFNLMKRQSKLTQSIVTSDSVLVCFLTIICIHEAPYKPAALVFHAVVCGFACFYVLVRTAAVWATLKISKPEIDMVYTYLSRMA